MTTFISIRGKHLISYVADNVKSHREGLSSFDKIGEDESMLFIFDEDEIHPFWMKDMKFPIDIVWLDSNKKVVFIRENAKPEEYPEVYYPNVVSRYVLEFNEGFVKKNNIVVGDVFEW